MTWPTFNTSPTASNIFPLEVPIPFMKFNLSILFVRDQYVLLDTISRWLPSKTKEIIYLPIKWRLYLPRHQTGIPRGLHGIISTPNFSISYWNFIFSLTLNITLQLNISSWKKARLYRKMQINKNSRIFLVLFKCQLKFLLK